MPDVNDTAAEKTGRQRRSPLARWRGLSRSSKRWIGIIAIVSAVIAVFVLVPAYIATRPAFVKRYVNLAPEYATWSTSIHATVPCQKCHVPPTTVARVGYTSRMLGEFYLSIVAPSRQPALYAPPTNAACQSCHIELRTVSPSGDLNIPHRAHVDVLKMRCITCHRYLVHQANPEGDHNPRMQTCLTCHNGVKAKAGCPTCHTAKVQPLSHHTVDWLSTHAKAASAPGADCKRCHGWTANWCAECHSHRPASHAATWRTTHGAAVKANRDCEACHAPAFCIRCHGVVPQLNFNPALKLVQ